MGKHSNACGIDAAAVVVGGCGGSKGNTRLVFLFLLLHGGLITVIRIPSSIAVQWHRRSSTPDHAVIETL